MTKLSVQIRNDRARILDSISLAIGMPVDRSSIKEPEKVGYQRRNISYDVPLSNSIPSPQTYETVREKVKKHYDRMGAVLPPVPTRKRVPDNKIVDGTPAASAIKDVRSITAKHSVFYDVRTGEIVLVVLHDSKADHFYTRYYEGKTSFPHISKMRGDEMRDIVRADIPPVMLVVNDEPVFWGYSAALQHRMKTNKAFSESVKAAKSCWLQLQPPMICNPRVRPEFDLPRLRFVLALMSQIKSSR